MCVQALSHPLIERTALADRTDQFLYRTVFSEHALFNKKESRRAGELTDFKFFFCFKKHSYERTFFNLIKLRSPDAVDNARSSIDANRRTKYVRHM